MRTLLLVLLVSISAPAQRHLYTWFGGGVADLLGSSVSGAGDVNRDGHADVLVGFPRRKTVLVYSGRDGMLLRTLTGVFTVSGFGKAVAGGGDMDRDGYPDLIIGSPHTGNTNPSGKVFVISGRTGGTLRTLHAARTSWVMGQSVANAGDVDRDGISDVLAGAPDIDRAYVFSGKDGRQLHEIWRSTSHTYGKAVSGAGDLDRDGHADVVVGGDGANIRGKGWVGTYSGRTGKLLHLWEADTAGDGFGVAVSGGGDVNGDGYPDVIVGTVGPKAPSSMIRVFSGKNGTTLYTVSAGSTRDSFGAAIAQAGDVDADGHADFVVGAPIGNYATLISGESGKAIYTASGATWTYFGQAVGGAGDVNRDGIPDLIIGVPQDKRGAHLGGAATVISGASLPLTTDTHWLSVSRAGVQTFSIRASTTYAGHAYLLAGSLSGDRPGFPAGALTVPLNPDGYLHFTRQYPNAPPLSDSLGVLDASGNATAKLTAIPALCTPLVGMTAHHAVGIWGASGLARISDAVPVTFGR